MGVLLLFGGGLALAAAVSGNGVDVYVGTLLTQLSTVPLLLIILIVAVTVVLLTELTSNTATTAALSASCAFALPVATPPNAIVFGSGQVTIPQMVRAGVVLNVVGTVLIVLTVVTLVPLVFGT